MSEQGQLFPCLKCSFKSSKASNLRNHLMNKHAFKKATDMKEVEQMSQQQKEDIEQKTSYKCEQCHHVATKKLSLKLHVQSKHEGLRFPCDHCDYKATQKHLLKKHITEKHDGMMFVCNGEKCELKFWTKIELADHKRSIHENDPFLCDLCDFKSNSSVGIQTHLQAHCNFCEQCDFVGISKKVIKTHKKNVHENLILLNEQEDDPMQDPLTSMACTWCLGERPSAASDCGPLLDACRALYPELNMDYTELSFEHF